MRGIRSDIGFAFRSVTGRPGLATAMILVLALAIGANTVIFSIFDGVVLKALPYPAPERVVSVWETDREAGIYRNQVSSGNYLDWRDRNRSFEAIGAYQGGHPVTLDADGTPLRIRAVPITPSVLDVLRVPPAIGSAFPAESSSAPDQNTVLLSHRFWRSQLGGDPGLVGEILRIEGGSFQVLGIMPEDFRFPDRGADVWVPRYMGADARQNRKSHNLQVVARLAPGVTLEQARADMRRLADEIHEEHPAFMQGFGTSVLSLHDDLVAGSRDMLWMLMSAVGLVLLIACVNLANLMLARQVARDQEFSLRRALGATPTRIARLVTAEALIYGVCGGALGVGLAHAGLDLVLALAPSGIPRLEEVRLDGGIIAFTTAITLVSILLIALLPAFRTLRADDSGHLHEGGRGQAGSPMRWRRGLVVSEVALTCLLTVAAGLMVRSNIALINEDPGFRTSDITTVSVSLPDSRYPGSQEQIIALQQMREALESVPGVEAVTGVPELPAGGAGNTYSYVVEGQPRSGPNPREKPVPMRAVLESFFDTMEVALLAGRAFSPRDRTDGRPVTVVNRSFAEQHWPGQDPLGRRISFDGHEGPWLEVVGVVEDTRHIRVHQEARPTFYIPFSQKRWDWMAWMSFLIRTAPGTEVDTDSISHAIWSVDDALALGPVRSLEAVLAESNSTRRASMAVLVSFGVLGLVLSVIGVYGVLSYSVSSRFAEYGVRKAVGASSWRILGHVLGNAAILVLVGLGLGGLAAMAASRYLAGQLYGIQALDPVTFFLAPALLALAAVTASLIPAQRAARINPLEALRHE